MERFLTQTRGATVDGSRQRLSTICSTPYLLFKRSINPASSSGRVAAADADAAARPGLALIAAAAAGREAGLAGESAPQSESSMRIGESGARETANATAAAALDERCGCAGTDEEAPVAAVATVAAAVAEHRSHRLGPCVRSISLELPSLTSAPERCDPNGWDRNERDCDRDCEPHQALSASSSSSAIGMELSAAAAAAARTSAREEVFERDAGAPAAATLSACIMGRESERTGPKGADEGDGAGTAVAAAEAVGVARRFDLGRVGSRSRRECATEEGESPPAAAAVRGKSAPAPTRAREGDRDLERLLRALARGPPLALTVAGRFSLFSPHSRRTTIACTGAAGEEATELEPALERGFLAPAAAEAATEAAFASFAALASRQSCIICRWAIWRNLTPASRKYWPSVRGSVGTAAAPPLDTTTAGPPPATGAWNRCEFSTSAHHGVV